jgi:predicted branched-subunit amino acid permease
MSRGSQAAAFAQGLKLVCSVPAAVLFSTALGFGALARDGGFTAGQAAFMAVSMFALPNQVMLADQLMRGATLAGAALAVTLTAVRLMPMTVTLVPWLRGSTSPRLLLVLAAHFVAITTWIEGNRRLPNFAPSLRLAHFLGIGVAVAFAMLAGTAAGYGLAGRVPAVVSAALLFLTPLYFILSLIGTSRSSMDLAAIVLGCALAPLLYFLLPGFDLLATGLIGGSIAFAWGRGVARLPWRR